MGEEEKKPEEKKPEEAKKPAEEKKAEEKPAGEKKTEEKKAEEKKAEDGKEAKDKAPPPPQEIVLKVYMHCEGCARKVKRCLKGFEGVEDVMTDCKTHKVVVKGEKADPLKVLERVQRKSHRQVDLLSPIPKPPAEKKPEEKEKPKPEEKKEEPQVITVLLKVHMHCDACAQAIKKRIERMKGVEMAEPDLKGSLVTVKGAFDPPKLVEYVYKRTGKHAVIVKQEADNKKDKEADNKKDKGGDNKEEKKGGGGEGDKDKKGGGAAEVAEENKDKKGEDSEAKAAAPAAEGAEAVSSEEKKVEVKMNEFSYDSSRYPYAMEVHAYNAYNAYNANNAYNAYAPQIFSDENPNACSVM